MKKYDVIVVGAGSGGLTSAVGFKNIGKSVLLIEREHMGGECTNTGCIPSKAILHRATEYHTAISVSGKTPKTESFKEGTFKHIQDTIDGILEHETVEQFEKKGIDVVMGEAEFISPNSLKVGDNAYQFETSVIATGSSPRMINIEGLNEKDILTNQNVFSQDSVPKNLLVIGSGPIGMELGQAFAMLGSNVTIATRDDRFARLEDPAISQVIERKFKSLGINIILNSAVTSVSKNNATVSVGDEIQTVEFDKILVAIGRVPNIPMGLESAGVKSNEYGITTNKHFQTTNKNIFAVGDVSLRLKFTHTADDAARHVVKRSLLKVFPLASQNTKEVPKVTYTRPSIAAVGLSYDQAVDKYGKNKIVRLEAGYSENDRAITDNATEYGHAVVIVKKISGKVLGANIIGQSSGEILSLFTLAIEDGISMWRLNKLIYPYPTISLIVKKLSDKFLAYQLGNLKVDLLTYFKK